MDLVAQIRRVAEISRTTSQCLASLSCLLLRLSLPFGTSSRLWKWTRVARSFTDTSSTHHLCSKPDLYYTISHSSPERWCNNDDGSRAHAGASRTDSQQCLHVPKPQNHGIELDHSLLVHLNESNISHIRALSCVAIARSARWLSLMRGPSVPPWRPIIPSRESESAYVSSVDWYLAHGGPLAHIPSRYSYATSRLKRLECCSSPWTLVQPSRPSIYPYELASRATLRRSSSEPIQPSNRRTRRETACANQELENSLVVSLTIPRSLYSTWAYVLSRWEYPPIFGPADHVDLRYCLWLCYLPSPDQQFWRQRCARVSHRYCDQQHLTRALFGGTFDRFGRYLWSGFGHISQPNPYSLDRSGTILEPMASRSSVMRLRAIRRWPTWIWRCVSSSGRAWTTTEQRDIPWTCAEE